MAEDTLPPLPKPGVMGKVMDSTGRIYDVHGYTDAVVLAHREEYAAARVAQAVAQERARAIPAGWRLVPEEATQAMVNEALSAVLTSPAGYAEIYRAMVNAAPQPPSGIVAATGFAQVIDGPKEPTLQWDEAPRPVAYRYWKDKFACWEYSDTPLQFPAVPAGTVMEPLYLHQPQPPSAGEEP